ncbi:unnamed protein product [Pseudo-nitzschia multistriata]|uniref:Neurotransmitter-gated ion-channel transmembrane domain-containing protein n=1 Tax=Pseudo-nitzschia multistriata TaxID=183589 RepID=A0A448ZFI1_9STRA|nr:unnamed protein product [Pseudo-nitzschia multistriata]
MVHYQFPTEATINVAQSDAKYNEFTPLPELFEKGYTWSFNTDYPQAMYYNFYFKRAEDFYIYNVLLPAMVLTYCSFGTFLLDMRVGERLGFVMALALVIIAAQIVTFDLVPVSSSKLWIDKFVSRSFYWVLTVLLQSVLVAFVSILREDRKEKKVRQDELIEKASANQAANETENVAGVVAGSTEKKNEVEGRELEKEESIVWTFSLRKFDFICLAICIVTYSLFVIAMFVSNFNGSWTKEDPEWFTPDNSFGWDEFPNNHYNDPNTDL